VKAECLEAQYDELKARGASPMVDPDIDNGEEQCCVKCGHTILRNTWGMGVCACNTGLGICRGFPSPEPMTKPCRLFTEADLE